LNGLAAVNALLDTNVVSEPTRKAPEPSVATWAASPHAEILSFSAVGEAELRYGAAIPTVDRRRETPVADIERMLRAFAGRTPVRPGISVTGG